MAEVASPAEPSKTDSMSEQPADTPPTYDDVLLEEGMQPAIHLDHSPPEIATPESPAEAQGAGQLVPKLTFVDFLPNCTQSGDKKSELPPRFESFRNTCVRANQWLMVNPGCRIVSVEESDRPVNWDGSYVLDSSLTFSFATGINLTVRALRLWVRPRFPGDVAPPEQLDYLNHMPHFDSASTGPLGPSGITLNVSRSGEYLNIDNTVTMLNLRLGETPLQAGRILSVRTIQLPLGDVQYMSEIRVTEDMLDQTVFSCPGSGNTFFHFLRVYYVRGEPCQGPISIGMADFIPRITSKASQHQIGPPKFESFSTVSQSAGLWAMEHHGRDLEILNFQTLTHDMDLLSPRVIDRPNIDTRKTCVHLTSPSRISRSVKRLHVKFLRVSYIQPLRYPAPPLQLSTRTVPPVLITLKTAETTGQNAGRVSDWLHHSGACVFGVESLDLPYHEHTGRCDVDTASSTSDTRCSYRLRVIRMYINGPYTEPVVVQEPGPEVETAAENKEEEPSQSGYKCSIM